MCTLANEATETHCLACGNARPAAATAAAPAVAAAMAGSAPSPLPDSTSGAAGGRDESQLRETLQSMQDAATCPVCLDQAKNMVFQCGHQTCSTCGPTLTACPIWYGILLLLLALRYTFAMRCLILLWLLCCCPQSCNYHNSNQDVWMIGKGQRREDGRK